MLADRALALLRPDGQYARLRGDDGGGAGTEVDPRVHWRLRAQQRAAHARAAQSGGMQDAIRQPPRRCVHGQPRHGRVAHTRHGDLCAIADQVASAAVRLHLQPALRCARRIGVEEVREVICLASAKLRSVRLNQPAGLADGERVGV